ncbi:MAG TPA: S1C family serine protease [Steroidobacteraceae bacterium]|jgi:S1-C subfamily serine protease|nr:S1C family serine protease [Steroidobacteraceae bacterium]
MDDTIEWAFPEALQPKPQSLSFDLEQALDAVVLVHAEVPEDAFTASILGVKRLGSGVVIRPDGLVLTIGYLITEAETIWLTTRDGTVVPAHALAYDYVTGFGLVAPLGRVSLPVIERGTTATAPIGSEVLVLSHGGRGHTLTARIVDKREFAGYWEYLLDEAVFTAPAHPHWSGAALVGMDGKLLGIGSLLVQEPIGGESIDANMFVPIDLLEPILDDLSRMGRAARTPRPWLGLYATESQGQLVVNGLATDGPAARAGVRLGDRVLEVAGQRVSGLPDLLRKVWRLGPAGTDIPLTLARGPSRSRVHVRSKDRDELLKKPLRH